MSKKEIIYNKFSKKATKVNKHILPIEVLSEKEIEEVVNRVLKEYGEVIRRLGRE